MIKVGGWSTTCPNSRCVRQTSLPLWSLLHCFVHCGCSPTRSSFTGPARRLAGSGAPPASSPGREPHRRPLLPRPRRPWRPCAQRGRSSSVLSVGRERPSLAALVHAPATTSRRGTQDAQRRLGALFPYPPRQSNKNLGADRREPKSPLSRLAGKGRGEGKATIPSVNRPSSGAIARGKTDVFRRPPALRSASSGRKDAPVSPPSDFQRRAGRTKMKE